MHACTVVEFFRSHLFLSFFVCVWFFRAASRRPHKSSARANHRGTARSVYCFRFFIGMYINKKTPLHTAIYSSTLAFHYIPVLTSVCWCNGTDCQPAAAAEQEQQQRGVQVRKTRPAWSPAAAAEGSVRPEMRAVPGGPDPLHHHGGSPSRRPAAGTHPVTRPAGQPAWLG